MAETLRSSGSSMDGLLYFRGNRVGSSTIQMLKDLSEFHPVKEEWKLKGNCSQRGIDITVFFNDMMSTPGHSERKKKIDEAVAICHSRGGCPVMAECERYHTKKEKEWMVVGGLKPGRRRSFRASGEGRNLSGSKALAVYDGEIVKPYCANGHDRRLPEALGPQGKCRACNRERKAKTRAVIKAATMEA